MSTTYRDRIATSRSKLRSTAEPIAAALALAALAGRAQAVTVYTVADPAFGDPSFAFGGRSINPLTGTYGLIGTWADANNPITVGYCGGGFYIHNSQSDLAFAGSGYELTLEAAGTVLDDSISFGATNGYGWEGSTLTDAAPNYYAFRYINQGVNHDETYYGWVEFNSDSSGLQTVTELTRFALGSNGESVTVGAIPEPTSFVFSIVASGLLLTRRKR